VEFNMPACFMLGDLNGDCTLTVADWVRFRGGQHANLMGLSPSEAYARGDLNGDFQNNHADFVIFKAAFDAANGTGAFQLMLTRVPEPESLIIAFCGLAAWLTAARRR
jgi:hypothetical protein